MKVGPEQGKTCYNTFNMNDVPGPALSTGSRTNGTTLKKPYNFDENEKVKKMASFGQTFLGVSLMAQKLTLRLCFQVSESLTQKQN